jgi:hypothetical protein
MALEINLVKSNYAIRTLNKNRVSLHIPIVLENDLFYLLVRLQN